MTVSSTHIAHKRLKRKQEILDEALQMITRDGLQSLTMQKLASAKGLTAGALYRYFRSKAEIISALEAQILRGLSERLAAQLATLPLPPHAQSAALHRLCFCAQFYLRHGAEHPEQASLIAMLLADPSHHVSDEELPALSVDFIGLFTQLVEELAKAEECGALSAGDAQRRALVFWSSLQGACSLAKLQRVAADFFDPMRAGEELTKTLLLGWGAKAELITAELLDFGTRLEKLEDKKS